MPRPVALVTGASAGIGRALAREFARKRHDLVLVARRRERLEELAAEIGPATRIAVADLSDPAAAARLFAETGPVDVLVNNAGVGSTGPFAESDGARDTEIIQVNVAAVTALTRLFLPAMLGRGRGRILNVASTAGFQPTPRFAVYAATKAYVLSLTEALHTELAGTGVTVTCLCPGATVTEFADKAGMNTERLFKAAMSAEAVAREGVIGTLLGHRLVVPGAANRLGTVGVRFAPRGLVLALANRFVAAVE